MDSYLINLVNEEGGNIYNWNRSGDSIDYLTLRAFTCLQKSDVGIYIGNMIGNEIRQLFEKKNHTFLMTLVSIL